MGKTKLIYVDNKQLDQDPRQNELSLNAYIFFLTEGSALVNGDSHEPEN